MIVDGAALTILLPVESPRIVGRLRVCEVAAQFGEMFLAPGSRRLSGRRAIPRNCKFVFCSLAGSRTSEKSKIRPS